jgi:putative ABC transport system substrate-binding protein
MRRREFLGALGGAAAMWPLAARAQQPAMPVIGLLRSTPRQTFEHVEVALGQGLAEAGFVEGRNVLIESRYADNQRDRLPDLAADLVRRRVVAIVVNGSATQAAKAATMSIPIIFVTGDDPVRSGIVDSLSRPTGNITGVTFLGGPPLAAKRLDLIRELVPNANLVAVLLNPDTPEFEGDLRALEIAGRAMGRTLLIVKVGNEREIDAAFATIVQSGTRALLIGAGAFFTSQRRRLVELAAQHAIPTIFSQRDFVEIGGLISYGSSFIGAYHQAGIYVGRILKGATPADLPVVQPSKFELLINMKTAKTLGLSVPLTLQASADEVIE